MGVADEAAAQLAALAAAKAATGQGVTPSKKASDESVKVVEVDNERARMEFLQGYKEHLVGDRDPLAISKIRPYYGEKLADYLSICDDLEARFHYPMNRMRKWAYNHLKSKLKSRGDLNQIADNLSKPVQEKNWLQKVLGR